MFTTLLIGCVAVFTLLTLGAWVGLAEYVVKATLGREAIGTVVRLEPDRVYPGHELPVVAFETESGTVELTCDGIWTGRAFLRVGDTRSVRYLRDPARAVVLDLSELGQQLIGVVLTTPLATGFSLWLWLWVQAQ